MIHAQGRVIEDHEKRLRDGNEEILRLRSDGATLRSENFGIKKEVGNLSAKLDRLTQETRTDRPIPPGAKLFAMIPVEKSQLRSTHNSLGTRPGNSSSQSGSVPSASAHGKRSFTDFQGDGSGLSQLTGEASTSSQQVTKAASDNRLDDPTTLISLTTLGLIRGPYSTGSQRLPSIATGPVEERRAFCVRPLHIRTQDHINLMERLTTSLFQGFYQSLQGKTNYLPVYKYPDITTLDDHRAPTNTYREESAPTHSVSLSAKSGDRPLYYQPRLYRTAAEGDPDPYNESHIITQIYRLPRGAQWEDIKVTEVPILGGRRGIMLSVFNPDLHDVQKRELQTQVSLMVEVKGDFDLPPSRVSRQLIRDPSPPISIGQGWKAGLATPIIGFDVRHELNEIGEYVYMCSREPFNVNQVYGRGVPTRRGEAGICSYSRDASKVIRAQGLKEARSSSPLPAFHSIARFFL
ncbi:hypothetical protein P7C73_g2314, partial [Tremellales sp. Uapishka_1]